MESFNLSSSQKMLLFSEINNPHNDSFYLKFRKDYDLEDLEYVKKAIKINPVSSRILLELSEIYKY